MSILSLSIIRRCRGWLRGHVIDRCPSGPGTLSDPGV